jgi:hypothetical protein
VHTFTTHNSPRYWHQADQFLPERFLQPGAEYASSGPGQQGQAAARGGAAPADHAGGLHSGGASSLPPGDSPRGGGIGGGGAASQPLRFFPFSQGARDCIGQSLAKINYTATLAALLGRYSFKLAPEVSGTAPPVGVFGVEGGSAGGACGDPMVPVSTLCAVNCCTAVLLYCCSPMCLLAFHDIARHAAPRRPPLRLPALPGMPYLQAAGPGGVRDVVSLTLQPEHGVPMLAVPRVAPAAVPAAC